MFAYALTIFTGAFLLFQVQPLIGKYILPWFGGSPGVWTTCMLFFQTMLLAGYAYAHFSAKKLKPKQQALLHAVLLVLALVLLPVTPSDHWKPTGEGNPIWEILLLLTANLGIPFLVLSATSPLIQHWCSRTHPGVSPYRLYALSNVGSLLALLSYPFYFEWAFHRSTQGSLWSWGFGVFALLCGACIIQMRKASTPEVTQKAQEEEPAAMPSATNRFLWLALPALASLLLLATTNKLCQDLAVVPFLWVVPLSIYLLSFIICFDSPRWYLRSVFGALLLVGYVVVAELLSGDHDVSVLVQIIGYGGALFAACMFCHGELYRLKPHPRYLTSFYLMIAAGGAIGGFLVAVVAPLVFNTFLEMPLGYAVLSFMAVWICIRSKDRSLTFGAIAGIVVAIVIVPVLLGTKLTHSGAVGTAFREMGHYVADYWKEIAAVAVAALFSIVDFEKGYLRTWNLRVSSFFLFVALALSGVFVIQIIDANESAISHNRSFFGVLTVYDYNTDDPADHYYLLEHGKITHGIQFTDPVKARWHTTYYGPTSGIGRGFDALPSKAGSRRIGLVGLGTGSLSSYATPGDYMRIYEINSQVRKLATSRFTYLANCGATVDVVLGDARLSMENEVKRGDPQRFDILALDAFNSDAIPVHLLTEEAFAIYLKELKPNGIIAVHISNLYFDLQPVVEKLAQRFNLDCVTISDDDNPDWWVYDTTWMLVSPDHTVLKAKVVSGVADEPKKNANPAPPLWTDDYTSLYKILRS